jgi:pantoate--beta-alanine ligase
MSPAVVHTAGELRRALEPIWRSETVLGFVPTMGALHEGHAALIRRASEECGFTAVSIFVNPIQFDRAEDYELYARTLAEDIELCRACGALLVFAPPVGEMYPTASLTHVEVSIVTDHLCGQYRGSHFRGVATVVAKLLNLVQPARAYFGEKDAQQLAVVRRMVADLNFLVQVIGVPTVREADGLALSSRNRRLSPEERRDAPALYRSLLAARAAVERGSGPVEARQDALTVLASIPSIRVEYLEVVDDESQTPVSRIDGPVRISAAVWLGATRLIDNVSASPPRFDRS